MDSQGNEISHLSTNIFSDGCQIVLTGDPKQLGAVIRSPIVKNQLELSLLERLITKDNLYQRQAKYKGYGYYNPLYITKLVDNYRSHPTILQLPSE